MISKTVISDLENGYLEYNLKTRFWVTLKHAPQPPFNPTPTPVHPWERVLIRPYSDSSLFSVYFRKVTPANNEGRLYILFVNLWETVWGFTWKYYFDFIYDLKLLCGFSMTQCSADAPKWTSKWWELFLYILRHVKIYWTKLKWFTVVTIRYKRSLANNDRKGEHHIREQACMNRPRQYWHSCSNKSSQKWLKNCYLATTTNLVSHRIEGKSIISRQMSCVFKKIIQVLSSSLTKPDESSDDDDDECKAFRDREEVDDPD